MTVATDGGPEQASLPPRAGVTRRRVLTAGAGLAVLAASTTAVYAGAIEPQGLVVTRYGLTPRAWPTGRSSPSR